MEEFDRPPYLKCSFGFRVLLGLLICSAGMLICSHVVRAGHLARVAWRQPGEATQLTNDCSSQFESVLSYLSTTVIIQPVVFQSYSNESKGMR